MALVNFTGIQYKDSVLLNFIVGKGFSCNGINIERSADSLNFSVIGGIQGICGSADYETPFQFTDKSPLINADNYYRLDLGLYGFSQALKVAFVKFNVAGYLFYPDPCRFNCSLFFENPTNAEVKFFIYHYSGREVFQKKYHGTQIEVDRKKSFFRNLLLPAY